MSRTRVYIGQLPYDARTREIERMFGSVGPMVDVHMRYGFCFVEYRSTRDAEHAVKRYDGEWFGGRRLCVEFARAPERERRRSRSIRRSPLRIGYYDSNDRDRYSRRSRSPDRRRSRSFDRPSRFGDRDRRDARSPDRRRSCRTDEGRLSRSRSPRYAKSPIRHRRRSRSSSSSDSDSRSVSPKRLNPSSPKCKSPPEEGELNSPVPVEKRVEEEIVADVESNVEVVEPAANAETDCVKVDHVEVGAEVEGNADVVAEASMGESEVDISAMNFSENEALVACASPASVRAESLERSLLYEEL